jgi:hypothetical protein
MVQYRLSYRRLIWNDYLAYSAVVYPVVIWAICVFLALVDTWQAGGRWSPGANTMALGYIAVLITLVCIPLLGWRFAKLYGILKTGIEVPGKVKAVFFFRDRGQVAYTYKYEGKSYQTRATLHRSRQTRALQPEDAVTLVVSKKDPRRAFIRDLYLEA